MKLKYNSFSIIFPQSDEAPRVISLEFIGSGDSPLCKVIALKALFLSGLLDWEDLNAEIEVHAIEVHG